MKIRVAVASVFACFTLVALLGALGLRMNTSHSVAARFFWRIDAPIKKGAYVLFCPPKATAFDIARARNYLAWGECPGEYGQMLKYVAAISGDVVTVNDTGVHVNGVLLAHSTPLRHDGQGQVLPQWRVSNYRLGDEDLLLMTDSSDKSFDARYFGLLRRGQVLEVVRPLL